MASADEGPKYPFSAKATISHGKFGLRFWLAIPRPHPPRYGKAVTVPQIGKENFTGMEGENTIPTQPNVVWVVAL